MKVIGYKEILALAVQKIKSQAMAGVFDGRADSVYNKVYIDESRWWIKNFDCLIIFTRDTGHHSSGWWKNPDYERCWHLSISFPGGRNQAAIDKMVDLLFGENKKWIWVEPPYSDPGKSAEVWHYRLFCDQNWQPLKPRGEVYSKEFTEKGWKSYSEVQAEIKQSKQGSDG